MASKKSKVQTPAGKSTAAITCYMRVTHTYGWQGSCTPPRVRQDLGVTLTTNKITTDLHSCTLSKYPGNRSVIGVASYCSVEEPGTFTPMKRPEGRDRNHPMGYDVRFDPKGWLQAQRDEANFSKLKRMIQTKLQIAVKKGYTHVEVTEMDNTLTIDLATDIDRIMDLLTPIEEMQKWSLAFDAASEAAIDAEIEAEEAEEEEARREQEENQPLERSAPARKSNVICISTSPLWNRGNFAEAAQG